MSGRIELKYFINAHQQKFLLKNWYSYLCNAPFTNDQSSYPILSLYYDSPTLSFYQEKLSGIAFRNKVRLRTYGLQFSEKNTTFMEIKHKQRDHIMKVRMRLESFDPDLRFPEKWKFTETSKGKVFGQLREQYLLRPAVHTFYYRNAYESPQWSDLRITFDSMLIALHPEEKLNENILYDNSRYVIPEYISILEIKSNSPLPDWIFEGIQQCELRCTRISKYVLCVDHLKLNEQQTASYLLS